MNFDSLPTEIKSLIFSYLPVRDLYINVSNVSTNWQSLSRDPHIVQHIEIDSHFTPIQIVECLRYYHLAQTLKISDVNSFYWLSEPLSLPRLRRIYFKNCCFQTTDVIEQLSKTFSTITALKVKFCKQHGAHNHGFVGTCKLIKSFAQSCQQLEEVDVDTKSLVTQTTFQLLTRLQGSTLKKLSLNGSMLHNSSYMSLKICPQLSELRLYKACRLTNSGLRTIMGLKHLNVLWLREASALTANAYVEFFTNGAFPNLRAINLTGCCNLTDDAVISLARSCPKLTRLNLSNCRKITDVSILAIIENCSDLEILYLSDNEKITENILPHISSHLKHLTYLNLFRCKKIKPNDINIQQMVRARPELVVIYPNDNRC